MAGKETVETFTDVLVSPKAVARALGVSESSVKRWCDDGALATTRTPGGHRRIPLASVLRFAAERGTPIRDRAVLVGGGRLEAAVGPAHEPQKARGRLREALRAGHFADVLATLEAALARANVAALADDLIAPVFADLGERWRRGALEIYEERRACDLMLRALHDLGARLPEAKSPRAIGGALEGDPYSLPTMITELVLREQRWNATSFGIGLPASTLARAVARHRPALVWLSVGAIESSDALAASYAEIALVARRVGATVVVGGRALDREGRGALRGAVFASTMTELAALASALHPGTSLGRAREPID